MLAANSVSRSKTDKRSFHYQLVYTISIKIASKIFLTTNDLALAGSQPNFLLDI